MEFGGKKPLCKSLHIGVTYKHKDIWDNDQLPVSLSLTDFLTLSVAGTMFSIAKRFAGICVMMVEEWLKGKRISVVCLSIIR